MFLLGSVKEKKKKSILGKKAIKDEIFRIRKQTPKLFIIPLYAQEPANYFLLNTWNKQKRFSCLILQCTWTLNCWESVPKNPTIVGISRCLLNEQWMEVWRWKDRFWVREWQGETASLSHLFLFHFQSSKK